MRDYELKFTPTFALPQGTVIKIEFPAYFKICRSDYFTMPWDVPPSTITATNPDPLHYINYGLDDIT